jgi:putative transposase
MVVDPGEYAWSSHRHYAKGEADPLLQSHPAYDALGANAATRCEAYHQLVAQALADEELLAIRFYLQRQQALGTGRFQQQVSAMLGRRAGPGRRGRPRKAAENVL